jgi:hypothetical protein
MIATKIIRFPAAKKLDFELNPPLVSILANQFKLKLTLSREEPPEKFIAKKN